MGTSQFNSLRDLGFEGTIYPVHPKEEKVQNLKAYRSVLDLPEVPDLAVLVVPTKIVSKLLEECGEKGIKHAIIVSGGFKEVGAEGGDREQELTAIATKYGIRFLPSFRRFINGTQFPLEVVLFPSEKSLVPTIVFQTLK
jgi:acyl-CoA synthetase (NDP forming)